MTLFGQEDVLRFNVTVRYAIYVQGLQLAYYLSDIELGRLEWKRL